MVSGSRASIAFFLQIFINDLIWSGQNLDTQTIRHKNHRKWQTQPKVRDLNNHAVVSGNCNCDLRCPLPSLQAVGRSLSEWLLYGCGGGDVSFQRVCMSVWFWWLFSHFGTEREMGTLGNLPSGAICSISPSRKSFHRMSSEWIFLIVYALRSTKEIIHPKFFFLGLQRNKACFVGRHLGYEFASDTKVPGRELMKSMLG